MKGLAPKIAISAGSLALALLGAEAALRLKGFDPMEAALSGRVQLVRVSNAPGRGYELVPGASGQGWGTQVTVNSAGFRGPEVAPAREGRACLAALGDSVTFGNDLAFEDTWPARLESGLRARGEEVDVLNLALGGYDTMQEVATLEELGLRFRPTHVIVGYCVNDVGIVSMSMQTSFVEADRANPLYRSRIAQWLHARRTERAQQRALFELNREEAYARAFASEIDPLDEAVAARVAALHEVVSGSPTADQDLATRRIPPRWYASEARIGRLAHAFARLATLAEREGFDVTVLLIPYLEEDPGIEEGLAIVRALAEARGFEVVAPREAFRIEGFAELRIRPEDPIHPNARGHALLAQALSESGSLAPEAGSSSPAQ